MTAPGVVVDAQDLRFRWPGAAADTVVLPALRIAAGEQVFLRGASGSGKSTLLSLLAGVLPPQAGTLHVMGKDLATLSGPARDRLRADHLGVIFQQFNLLPWLSAHDNVTLALRFSTRRRAQAAEGEAGRLLGAMGLADALWRLAAVLRDTPGLSGTHHLTGWPDVSYAGLARHALGDGRVVEVRSADRAGARRPLNARLDGSSLLSTFGIPRPDWRAAVPRI